MSTTASVAMFSWPLVVVLLFTVLPPRRAVLTAFLLAWLFLPIVEFRVGGFPDYKKMTATSLGVFLGALMFDLRGLLAFRPRWVDLPIVVWFLCPMASSLSNDLGAYDGMSVLMDRAFTWGLPYFIGRVYFGDARGLRELAVGIVIGGLIYVPLCLFEVRMSPQLHAYVYGFHQHEFLQTLRYGGYRPMVFLQHGLAVGMWMAVASVLAFWLWRTGALRRVAQVSMGVLTAALFTTTVLCKSTGAVVLLALGSAALAATAWTRSRLWVAILILAPLLYLGSRVTGIWSGRDLVEAASWIGKDRAGSISSRLASEDILRDHALRRPAFGWGGWLRNRPKMQRWDSDIAMDGMWIIALGRQGLVGLASVVVAILLPAFLLWRRVPPSLWSHPRWAPASGLAIILILFMIDSLFNDMLNPIYLLAAGGLSSAMTARRAAKPSGAGLARRRLEELEEEDLLAEDDDVYVEDSDQRGFPVRGSRPGWAGGHR